MKRLLSVLLSFLFCLCPFHAIPEDTAGPSLSLFAINVRKADALLLRSGGSTYLIDTGTEESFEKLYSVLKQENIERLTGVILTHTHKDHTGGFDQLIRSDIEIENIYVSAYYNKKKESKHPAVKALKDTGRKVVFLSSGDELPLDGGKLSVIGPLEKDEEAENNNSLVLLAEGSGGSMLLTGDMEFPEEASLLNTGLIPHADILKVGNHGEDDATSNALLNAVRPSLAIVSTNSDDEPDTPSPRVLRLLASWNVPVLVTQNAENGVLVRMENGRIITELK